MATFDPNTFSSAFDIGGTPLSTGSPQLRSTHPGKHPGRFVMVQPPRAFYQPPPASPPAYAAPRIAPKPMNPGRHPGRFIAQQQPKAYYTPPAVIAPIGSAPIATFVMPLEGSTARLTYEYQTDIKKAWSGYEQRISLLSMPRQKYEFSPNLDDANMRNVLSLIAKNAATAQLFGLGLLFEETTVSSQGTTTTVNCNTTYCDWVIPGQRIVIAAPDFSSFVSAVIQSPLAANSGFLVDVDVHAIATPGAHVMPMMPIYLDAQQDFGRYPVNADQWDLRARAAVYGFSGTTNMGLNATVNTYNGISIWDQPLMPDTDLMAKQPAFSGAEFADFGGAVTQLQSYYVNDWGREMYFESSSPADFQWLKAFISAVRGCQALFLMTTGRPDLIISSGDASSGSITIFGPPTTNAPDYAGQWFQSLAHRRLAFRLASGAVAYRTVQNAVDNHNGTQTLSLDSALAGTISMVSFFEQCRLETDQIEVNFAGPMFQVSLSGRVVQQ